MIFLLFYHSPEYFQDSPTKRVQWIESQSKPSSRKCRSLGRVFVNTRYRIFTPTVNSWFEAIFTKISIHAAESKV